MTTFQYLSIYCFEPITLTISKPNATFFDAKNAIISDLSRRNKQITLSQLSLTVRGTPITNTDQLLSPNTIIKIHIKEDNHKSNFVKKDNENNDKKPIKTPDVFVKKETTKIEYRTNIKARKQIPKQLSENYICYRCHKPGHHIKNCPENNNRKYDNRKMQGIPKNMLEEVDGELQLKDLNGKGFHAAIQTYPKDDNLEIPNHLKCNFCSHILSGCVILRCCGKEICEDCLRTVKQNEKCPKCGKEIDLVKDIQPNMKTRELVTEYWRKINAENKKNIQKDEMKEEDTESNTENESDEMEIIENGNENENGNQLYGFPCESIPQQPIDEFFKVDIRNGIDSGEFDNSQKRFVWSMYKVPCQKEFDGVLLFSKRGKTVEEIFEENKQMILTKEKQMEEENENESEHE